MNRTLKTLRLVVCTLTLYAVSAAAELRGTGDLGLIVERADGSIQLVDTSQNKAFASVTGLGDLSHASAVFSRDSRYAFIFGRDGGLSRVDLLQQKITHRVMQAGNSIGGAISQNGELVAVSNYTPGGVKVFRSDNLEQVLDIPADYAGSDTPSKVVGLVDAPGQKFVFTLYDAGEIWVVDLSGDKPRIKRHKDIGTKPYDALITPEGRYYIAGLFGEDGLALLDLWHPEKGVRRILPDYGKGEKRLPVYKMPHLEGWAIANNRAYIPAVGHNEVLVVDTNNWQQIDTIKVQGQPIFVMARPDGRQVWVNFAYPRNSVVQVIDTDSNKVMRDLTPGKSVLHMEFTPRGEHVWVSARDDNKVVIYNTADFTQLAQIDAASPSGIFFTHRAHRIGL